MVLLGNDEFAHRRYVCDLRRSIQLATSISSAGLPSTPIVYVCFNPHFYTVDGTLFDTGLHGAHEKLWSVLQGLQGMEFFPGLKIPSWNVMIFRSRSALLLSVV